MVKFLLAFHIFTLSWQSILRMSDWTPLPVISLFLIAFSMLVAKSFKYKFNTNVSIRIEPFDLLIVLALILMLVSVLVYPTNKGMNYLLAYSAIYVAYLICLN